jgi:hypothetical protein
VFLFGLKLKKRRKLGNIKEKSTRKTVLDSAAEKEVQEVTEQTGEKESEEATGQIDEKELEEAGSDDTEIEQARNVCELLGLTECYSEIETDESELEYEMEYEL